MKIKPQILTKKKLGAITIYSELLTLRLGPRQRCREGQVSVIGTDTKPPFILTPCDLHQFSHLRDTHIIMLDYDIYLNCFKSGNMKWMKELGWWVCILDVLALIISAAFALTELKKKVYNGLIFHTCNKIVLYCAFIILKHASFTSILQEIKENLDSFFFQHYSYK